MIRLLEKFKRNQSRLKVPTAIADGVTHGEGGTWAWVMIPPRATDELNSATIFAMTDAGSSDLRRLIPAGAEFHFKIQWGRWSGEDYQTEELRPGMPEGTRDYIRLGSARIDENRFARRMVLLGVRMDEDQPGMRNIATNAAGRVLGTSAPKQDALTALAGTMKRISGFHERMRGSSFAARAATAQEISWALRRDLRRTVDWVPSTSRVDAGQMVRLRSTQVIPHATHVEVITDAGPRYLRMLCPSENGFPTTELELPGGEWLKHLNVVRQDVDDEDDEAAPIEVSIRGRNIPQQEARHRLRTALSLAKEQDREARRGLAEEAPDTVAESGLVLRERLREVQAGLVGMIEDAPVWIVEAGNLDQLDARTDALINHYGGMGITIWAPPAIQDLLWMETVVGDTRRVGEFAQFRPISTLVGAWFHGGSEVGARTGPYLAGNIGSTPGPFRNRLSDAQLTREAVTTAFLGTTGSGKSTGVMLSAIGEAALGSWVLLADYKGDLGGAAQVCEMFGIAVTRVSTSQRASGSMCPFRFIADPEVAMSYAIDNLVMLVSAGPGMVEVHVRRAALAVSRRPRPEDRSTWAVIQTLAEDKDPVARELGMQLLDLASDPLARPVVGAPDLSARQLPVTAGFIYMSFDDLRWPGRETPQAMWKPGHRLSMMVAQAGLAYATYMSSRVKGLPKVIALTELHRLTRYDFGRDVVGDIARTGSALDTNLLLDTQACAELLGIEGLADQITQVHAFRVETDDEADAQARMLGLEPEQSVRKRQKAWGKGQCLTRDRARRIAPIQFDYMSAAIEQALQTRPERHKPALVDEDEDIVTDEIIRDELSEQTYAFTGGNPFVRGDWPAEEGSDTANEIEEAG